MNGESRTNGASLDGERQTHYPQTKLNKIRVYKHRAHYDFQTVHSIIDSTFFSHVSFVGMDEDGQPTPITLPLTAVLGNYGDDNNMGPDMSDEALETQQKHAMRHGPMNVYLHGNAAAMLCKAIKASDIGAVKVCICSTKVDGLVLYPTPNGHSLNYRSGSIHGMASLVPDTDSQKKRWAMQLLTNHMWRGRWGNTYPVAPNAVKVVKVIEVQIRSASAKIRTGDTGSFDTNAVQEEDRRRIEQAGKGVWSGVVPLFEVLGTPVKSEDIEGIGGEDKGLETVQPWLEERNAREYAYAESLGRNPIFPSESLQSAVTRGADTMS
ncbi:hypothetical protein GQ53DRAFT_86544 [Thozetella sp. PMI_491]|nr:hypothetical protein GQ53DRAFT_86544 [Thozetella sp. PMI_491]